MNPEEEKLRLVQAYIESGMSPEEAMMEAESVIGEQNAVIDRPGSSGSREVDVNNIVRALKVAEQGSSDAGDLDFDSYKSQPSSAKSFAEGALRYFDPDKFNQSQEATPEEFEQEVVDSEPSPDSYEGETEEEAYERQIDTFNGMRNHVFDAEDQYMTTAEGESFDGNLNEGQLQDREMTKIVEALQREAASRGEGGDYSNIPMGMDGQSVLPQNPLDQQLRDMSGVGQQATQLQNTQDPQAQAQMQAQAMERIRLQGMQEDMGARYFMEQDQGLPGMTRHPGLGGNKGYSGDPSRGWNPYGGQ
jgi:hypothetical protein